MADGEAVPWLLTELEPPADEPLPWLLVELEPPPDEPILWLLELPMEELVELELLGGLLCIEPPPIEEEDELDELLGELLGGLGVGVLAGGCCAKSAVETNRKLTKLNNRIRDISWQLKLCTTTAPRLGACCQAKVISGPLAKNRS